jgi:hypothetical protein
MAGAQSPCYFLCLPIESVAMAREDENDTHQTIPTPNPQERALLVRVREEVFSHDPDVLPATGTSYGEFPREMFGADYRREYEDYLYKGQLDNAGTYAVLAFAKDKTEAEKNEPFRRVWKKHGNHRWPPILKSLYLLEDYNFPRSTNRVTRAGGSGVVIAPTYYDRVVYIPDTNEGTRFLVDEFFAATPFVIPRYQTPVATGVQYSINGLQGSFPECLHDDIEIPSTTTASIAYQSGSAAAAGGSLEGQFFPRTNFKNWRPYVVFDEQEEVPTGWSRMRIRVYPPMRPRAIRR